MMSYLSTDTARRSACLTAVFIAFCSLSAQLTWSPGGSAGGAGSWERGDTVFADGDQAVAFAEGEDLLFPQPAGVVEVVGDFTAGHLRVDSTAYTFELDNLLPSRLSISRLTGDPEFGFDGVIGAGADAYPGLATLRASGLVLEPAEAEEITATLSAFGGGSPLLRVVGDGGPVTFNGRWNSDTGSVISWLVLDEGAHFRLGPEADMRFIKNGFYTLQLWVSGDGDGLLELDPDFVADKTEKGSQRLGIGSIRLGAGTLRTHHSRNLPLGYRPQADGSAQTNGHMAFENSDGLRWEVRTNPQTYPGAVWVFRDLTVDTAVDLVHVGVSEAAPDYTARNGWSLIKDVTLTKTGAADLILAGEQAYAPGSSVVVKEGGLLLQRDPSAGRLRNGSQPGGTLNLVVETGARAEIQTDAAMQSLSSGGELVLGGRLTLGEGSFFDLQPGSRTRLLLSDTEATPLVECNGLAYFFGDLVVERLPGFQPGEATEWVLCRAVSVVGEVTLIDRTGMNLRIEKTDTEWRLVAGNPAPELPGAVLLEDDFSAPTDRWKDLSTVPLWGTPLQNRSAFEWVEGAVRLDRSGEGDTSSYINYRNSNGLKTFTALDHQFEAPVPHAQSEVTLDFRMRWPNPTEGSGEGGRVMFVFNHAYPDGGLDLTPEGGTGSRISDFSEEWWARPAYHIRLRNGTTRAGSSFLQYGGGASAEGEYERRGNDWWLAGFISGAGSVAPGDGDNFPANSWVRTSTGMATAEMRRFRYRILPDRQELWRDDNGDGVLQENELQAVMELPEESDAPLYRYFEQFEGLRVFWNGVDGGGLDSGQAEIDWLRLIVQDNLSPLAEAGEEQFAEAVVEDRALVRIDAGDSTDPETEPLRYFWYLQDELLLATDKAVASLLLPVGEHELTLLVRDPAGNTSKDTVPVTISSGPVRPVAEAGADQTVDASNDWFGVVALSGGASFSPDGEIVRYQWSIPSQARVLYDGSDALVHLALEPGNHLLTLRVWNEEDVFAEDTVRVVVESIEEQAPLELIYRENFSWPGNGGEAGPEEVGWGLMQYNGEPVPSVTYDGNAHRCLRGGGGSAVYRPKVSADPAGEEYEEQGSSGHLWMNQMPRQNVSPAEWMVWTQEFTIDLAEWELAQFSFHAADSSPWQELVAASLAVRIEEQWYVAWDLRAEINRSWWNEYDVPLQPTGWYRFEPSETFTIREADPVGRLPEGVIDAFGVYFFKEYAWYITDFDNFTLYVRPQRGPRPYGRWLVDNYGSVELANAVASRSWNTAADPDGDGWANLWEYSLGGDPLGYEPELGRGHRSVKDGSLRLALPADSTAVDLDFALWRTRDFQSWEQVLSRNVVRGIDPEDGGKSWSYPIPEDEGSWFYSWQPVFVE